MELVAIPAENGHANHPRLIEIREQRRHQGNYGKKSKNRQIKKFGGSTKGKRIVVGGSLDLNLEELVNGCF
jgi:hypothetical protein